MVGKPHLKNEFASNYYKIKGHNFAEKGRESMAGHEGKNRNIPVAGSEVSTAPTSGEEASGERVPLGQGFGVSALGKHLLSKGKEGKLPVALLLLSFLMALAILFYVLLSTTDVLYSDYIRLVNSYLGKPFQLGDLLQKDILTRIPLTYFFREINRHSFGYTLIFDRALGVLGLFLASKPLLLFMRKKQLSFSQQLLFLLLFYSLNKWEMLLNGSGYIHFLAFSAFYDYFYALDQAFSKKSSLLVLSIYPPFILLVAGPYCLAVFLSCFALFFFLALGKKLWDMKGTILLLISNGLCLFLYLLSNHYAVYEYAGAESISLREVLQNHLLFVVKFIFYGFSSMLVSGENLEKLLRDGVIQGKGIVLIGAFVLFFYIFMTLLYLWKFFASSGNGGGKVFSKKNDGAPSLNQGQKEAVNPIEKNPMAAEKGGESFYFGLLPGLLLLHGLASHALVFLTRYMFLKESYAFQSRYALQYQSALLGAFLLLFLWKNENRASLGQKARTAQGRLAVCLLFSGIFLLGTLWTDRSEWGKSMYRREHYERMWSYSHDLSAYSDEELEDVFEYRHGGERIRKAFAIWEQVKKDWRERR
ncbi:putative membrane protein [Oribacterium parvum ACB8]|nr:putative membrane protein [Oribacterium parvum ACB8]